MSIPLRLDDVRRAWEARDPEVVRLIALLAEHEDDPAAAQPREGAMTFDRFVASIRTKAFHKKPAAEQAHERIEGFKALESPAAEVPLPDRLKLHEVIAALWQDNGPLARWCLLEVIATVKLTYGPWRALKRIFKEAEARGDTEIYGALAARFDMAFAGQEHAVSRHTLGYLCRRAWRYLRRTGQTLPAVYPDTACDVLAWYTDQTMWHSTWVGNHVFYHETDQYGRGDFHFGWSNRPTSLTKHRAFAEAWQRTPRLLFSLL